MWVKKKLFVQESHPAEVFSFSLTRGRKVRCRALFSVCRVLCPCRAIETQKDSGIPLTLIRLLTFVFLCLSSLFRCSSHAAWLVALLRLQVTACGRGGNLEGAMTLLDTMRDAGVPPNCYTYNSAIHACARKVPLVLINYICQSSRLESPTGVVISRTNRSHIHFKDNT